jgi:hypothetical protein
MNPLISRKNVRKALCLTALMTQLCWVGGVSAQVPIPASTQFDITGFLQAATLDPACSGDGHCGGTLQVNGHTIVVPKETIVILPANALSWQELFAQAPAPYTATATGMAMSDLPVPLTTYEVHVVGNRVLGGPAGADVYIAGLVNVAQQGLNSGAGYINFMDYVLGEMRVGGVINDPNCRQGTSSTDVGCTGARVRINDPIGRFGRVNSPDPRFTVDADNPTIIAGTGFPMCFPRTDPLVVDDPKCPTTQRAPNQILINMNAPAVLAAGQVQPLDPRVQVPMQVGDYITFSGTLVTDAPTPTTGPDPGTAGTYIAAHTIVSNVAVFTAPGIDPAYVMTEVSLIGTGGLTVLGAGEAVIRTRFEGMSTDPTRLVHLYGIDLNPATGATSDRDWGVIGVDPGPGALGGAVKGRWRFRPPCLAFGTVPTKADKQCVMNASGTFLPVPREMRAVIEGQQTQVAALAAGDTTKTAANGIYFGQYHAPIGEYIFPENVPGSPILENNFNTVPFLASGGYTSAAGTLAGELNPWPSNVNPVATCAAPVVSAGGVNGAYTVGTGGTVQLVGSATGTTPTFLWTQTGGAPVVLSNATSASPTFVAPATAQVLTFTLTATACGTSATAGASVTVNAVATVPAINPITPISVVAGTRGALNLSAVNPSNPLANVTFTVTQAGLPALTGITTPTGSKANPSLTTVTFAAPSLPLGQIVPSVVTLTITAKIGNGAASAPVTVPVSIVPVPDTITLTSEYRTSKQRLVITAVSTNPGVTMILQPYLTDDGVTVFDPSVLGNTFAVVGGIPTLTLVGAPHPACNPGGAFAVPCAATPLEVKSNIGGTSGKQAIQKIRQ